MVPMLKNISIRGAREHNLKSVDVEIPRDTLTVITGLSGSGKSSLAFDTIYAEGQRRYVESLSAYARQFLELMQKPDVDHIEGLSPAISIEQKTTSRNPRSTVGTVTEIYDYLRLLFARVGVPYSPATGLPIESQTVSQMADRILTLPEGTRLYLLAPMVRGRKGEYRKEFAELQKKGFQRVKVDGKYYELGQVPALDKKIKHDIEVVVDRIAVKKDIGNRLPNSIETALELADGLLIVEFADEKEKGEPRRLILSSKFACPVSGFTIPEIEPRLFSFNNPHGACPACDGLGTQLYFDPALVVPDETMNLPQRRHCAVVEGLFALLPADARGSGAPVQIFAQHAVGRSAEESEGHNPARLRRGRGQIHLRRRPSPLRDQEGLRRRHTQHAAPLQGDGLLLGARRARAIPGHQPLRCLQGLPSEARSAVGEDRGTAYRRSLRAVNQGR